MDAVLAHQGGWDEILMFLTPIALVVGTWWLLERRKARKGDAAEDPAQEKPDPEPSPSDQ